MEPEKIIQQIEQAFSGVTYPGDDRLRGSNEGNEPFLLEAEFRGKTDWRTLDPHFIDLAPAGYGSALSFFSAEAFRFYIPAYLIADLRGQLECSMPPFQLCHGFDDVGKTRLINSRRYGDRVWFDYATERCAGFTREEAAAIVAYLEYRAGLEEFYRPMMEEALLNYWMERAQ